VGRSYPDDPYFKNPKNKAKQRLFNVLRAYANFDEQIGYTQGSNFIAGALLIILDPSKYPNIEKECAEGYYDSEERAFWFLVFIAFKKNWREMFKNGLPKARGMSQHFEEELKKEVPEVHSHIHKFDELSISVCFDQMMITMLLLKTPISIAQRIFDVFFIEGEPVLFKLLINAVTICRSDILSLNDAVDLNNYFRDKLMVSCMSKLSKSGSDMSALFGASPSWQL